MSASTAPAAVPDPQNNPGTTPGTPTPNTPAPGLFASMLAPVAPARNTAFSLDPQTAASTPTGAVLPAEGVSSTAFQGDDGDQRDANSAGTNTGSGKQPKGVVRAWLLAGAARWARGGGTQNKRLDMKKARALANQVKETRTVNSGPVAGPGGGRGSNASGAGGGKSLGSKSPKSSGSTGGGSPKSPKSTGPGAGSAGGAGRGPSGRDTNRSDRSLAGQKPGPGNSGAGRGTSGDTAASSKGNTTPAPKPGADNTSRSPKPPKDKPSSPLNSKAGASSGTGKTGPQGGTGTPGKSGTHGKADQVGKRGADTPKGGPAGKGETDTAREAQGAKRASGSATGADTSGTHPKRSLLKRKTNAETPANTDGKTKTPSDGKTAPGKPTPEKTSDQAKPTTSTVSADGKPFTTRPARETGYRDGTRAARTAAHVNAYRDGVKDGWADTTEAAQREKARLDQAHIDRKTARQEPPVTLAASTDHQNPDPTPITVKDVSSTHVFLGDGAGRASMTRGEVRSLKGFERRLEERATSLTSRAEQTRSLRAHADEQAKQATRLLDAARGAKGGDKLLGTLTKLQEAAQVQSAKADEIHKRSLRAADTTRTLLSNVQARYGGIYNAVIDSPETSPAELHFYKG